MADTLRVTRVTLIDTGPSYTIEYSWDGGATTHAHIDPNDAPAVDEALAVRLFVGMFSGRGGRMADLIGMENRTLTIDFGLDAPLVLGLV
jgi:hypothetical protein